MMKKTLNIMFVLALTALWLLSGTAQAQESTEPDSTGKSTVVYEHVDVVIDYGWGDPERLNDVHAEAILIYKKATKVVVEMPGHKGQLTVALIHGVKVRIYDHRTGKLLKTYESVLYS